MECCDPVRTLLISLELGLLICEMGTPISQKLAGRIKWNHVCKVTSAVTFSSFFITPPLLFPALFLTNILATKSQNSKTFLEDFYMVCHFLLIFLVEFSEMGAYFRLKKSHFFFLSWVTSFFSYLFFRQGLTVSHQLLGSSHLPASVTQVAGTTGRYLCTQLSYYIFLKGLWTYLELFSWNFWVS